MDLDNRALGTSSIAPTPIGLSPEALFPLLGEGLHCGRSLPPRVDVEPSGESGRGVSFEAPVTLSVTIALAPPMRTRPVLVCLFYLRVLHGLQQKSRD